MRLLYILCITLVLLVSYSKSDCSSCCASGSCLQAFRGEAGICCGTRSIETVFSRPYCCPTNARCVEAGDVYKCQLLTSSSEARNNPGLPGIIPTAIAGASLANSNIPTSTNTSNTDTSNTNTPNTNTNTNTTDDNDTNTNTPNTTDDNDSHDKHTRPTAPIDDTSNKTNFAWWKILLCVVGGLVLAVLLSYGIYSLLRYLKSHKDPSISVIPHSQEGDRRLGVGSMVRV